VTPSTSPASSGGTTAGGAPQPAPDSDFLPSSVESKYPGATVIELGDEDDGRQEMKIDFQGQCREIKTNSAGAITSDKPC